MKKVLVVDDEKLIVKGLKFSLEQDDMEVDVAYDGGEAFEKIKNNDYDIVLLDIMIPVYTGIEVCQMVREFSNVRSRSCSDRSNAYMDQIHFNCWRWRLLTFDGRVRV